MNSRDKANPFNINNNFKGYLDYKTNVSTTPAHVYFDIIISNRNGTSIPPKQITYFEMRNSSYLDCPQDYYLAICRFSLDTPSLPVFIPTIDLTNSGNFNPVQDVAQPTIYSITLTYTDVVSSKSYAGSQIFINWIPQFKNASLPQNTPTIQDLKTPYYYCYSYQWFITLINIAFKEAFDSLKSVVASDGVTLPVDNPPFMSWNIAEGTAIINTDIGTEAGGFLTTSLDGDAITIGNTSYANYSPINIYFNNALFDIFNSFIAYEIGYGATTVVDGLEINGGNIQIPIITYSGQNVIQQPIDAFNSGTGGTTYSCAQTFQEFSTVPMMNPVCSIVFTSNVLNVLPTNVATPYIYNGDTVISQSNNANISKIITDFQSTNGQYRSFIHYSPTIYRLIDLQGNAPISDLNLSVFWKGKDGTDHPLYLVSGASCSIKIMFVLKDHIAQ